MPRKIVAPAQPDPDAESNRRVLAERQRKLDDASPAKPAPARKESTADNALEFLSDEFDRKNFGDPIPTIERIVYGPDPLLDDPAFKERVERFGVEEIAEASAKAIIDKGAMAFPNPLMQTAIARAIRKFGVESVASAFHERVMRIPVRTVHIEMDRDDEVLGNPLREAVQRYGTPGMAPKFMSDACIATLSMRGYRIVRSETGDPVKVGTLTMTEIPQAIADKRRRAAAEESLQQVREAEQTYQESIERAVKEAGGAGLGSGPLATGEVFRANASEIESVVGQERRAGISYEELS